MNTPNKLTVFRMLIVPAIVIVSMINIPGEIIGIPLGYLIMDILFIIASITDKVDGYLARKNNQVTTFGKFLDPIADKILVVSAMIVLVGQGNVIAANKWGKLKTVTQMIAIILAFLDVNNFGAIFTMKLEPIPFILNLLVTLFMLICVIATIFSGYEYLKDAKDLLKDK